MIPHSVASACCILLFPALVVPSAALACPTAFGGGIVYRDAAGTVTTVTMAQQPGILHERVVLAEGDGYELTTFHGLFEVEAVDFDHRGAVIEETRQVSRYAEEPVLPPPGTSMSGFVARVVTGTETFERRHDVQTGPMESLVLAGCSFEGYSVEVLFDEPAGPILHLLARVPALGMTFYLGFVSADATESHDIIAIEALPVGAGTLTK
jgi:hypothetical protein